MRKEQNKLPIITKLLDSFKLLRSKVYREEQMFPLRKDAIFSSILPLLAQANSLSLGRVDRLMARIRITNNLLQFILKMNANHGTTYTIKWLKCCTVALQKYLGGDPLNSLRGLEPNIPLPRLINGCPSFINKADRHLMRSGNVWIQRFWLTQFSVYRILLGPMNPKLNSITDEFKGNSAELLTLVQSRYNPFVHLEKFAYISLNGIKTFHLSHASSPSNKISFHGLLFDYHNLTTGSWDLSTTLDNATPRKEWLNLKKYLEILTEHGLQNPITTHFVKFDIILKKLRELNVSLPHKSSIGGSGLSQFAFKEEAAGKLRIFALLDSITQSVLRPLHQYMFTILKKIPNDGTFDQDASVLRSKAKLKKFGIAYSFDLSSATDRLPATLTASIIECMLNIPGIGQAWLDVMVDREFYINSRSASKYFPKGLETLNLRYSVGQPMGGLSSWAGLAITHHWILQYCSKQLGNFSYWEERYEVLGDDIVIFDHQLAEKYLIIMNDLGVEINKSKSISNSSQVFEFAKRTVYNDSDVSGISLQQINSAVSMGSKVVNTFLFTSAGLIRSVPALAKSLIGAKGNSSFRDLKVVGLPALSLLNLLCSKELTKLRSVIEVLVNPQYKDFNLDQAKFDLPLHSLLRYCLDLLQGKLDSYPFSQVEKRAMLADKFCEPLIGALLYEARRKVNMLRDDYINLITKGSSFLTNSQVKDETLNFTIGLLFEDILLADRTDDSKQKSYAQHYFYKKLKAGENIISNKIARASLKVSTLQQMTLEFKKSMISVIPSSVDKLFNSVETAFLSHLTRQASSNDWSLKWDNKSGAFFLINASDELYLKDKLSKVNIMEPHPDETDEFTKQVNQFLLDTEPGKAPLLELQEALTLLEKVDLEIQSYTYKHNISRVKYDKDTSPVLQLLRKSRLHTSLRLYDKDTEHFPIG